MKTRDERFVFGYLLVNLAIYLGTDSEGLALFSLVVAAICVFAWSRQGDKP